MELDVVASVTLLLAGGTLHFCMLCFDWLKGFQFFFVSQKKLNCVHIFCLQGFTMSQKAFIDALRNHTESRVFYEDFCKNNSLKQRLSWHDTAEYIILIAVMRVKKRGGCSWVGALDTQNEINLLRENPSILIEEIPKYNDYLYRERQKKIEHEARLRLAKEKYEEDVEKAMNRLRGK